MDKKHKGQKLVTKIGSLAQLGAGVSRDHGMVIFVDRAVPGDQVEVELYDVRKDFAHAQIISIIEPSPSRIEPPCKIFKVCGGCQWQHIDYQAQLDAKRDIVCQSLQHIAQLDPNIVLPTLGSDTPFFYRNKVQFPVRNPVDSSRILAGYYQIGSHELVNIKHCPIQPEPLDRMLEAAKNALEQERITAYDEETKAGTLRHICARYSFSSKEILLTFVVNTDPDGQGTKSLMTKLGRASESIVEQVPEVVGTAINFNNRSGNRIMGDKTIGLSGKLYIVEHLSTTDSQLPQELHKGLDFQLSPTSFFQVNSPQLVHLLELVSHSVLDYQNKKAKPEEKPILIDAYAGVGTMALWLSALCDQVIAIEEHDQAADDAVTNNELNHISNVDVCHGRVEDILPEIKEMIGTDPDILLLDPPRKGLSPAAVAAAIALNCPRIIYISCNPASLARDLKVLEQNGYKTIRVQPVDMFPQTFHVESVAIVDRV